MNLNDKLIEALENNDLEIIKYLIAKGADIHAGNDCALRYSAYNGHLEVVKYFIFDCNIIIKEKTLNWLNSRNLLESLNIIRIINARDLNNKLNKKLDNSKVAIKKNKI